MPTTPSVLPGECAQSAHAPPVRFRRVARVEHARVVAGIAQRGQAHEAVESANAAWRARACSAKACSAHATFTRRRSAATMTSRLAHASRSIRRVAVPNFCTIEICGAALSSMSPKSKSWITRCVGVAQGGAKLSLRLNRPHRGRKDLRKPRALGDQPCAEVGAVGPNSNRPMQPGARAAYRDRAPPAAAATRWRPR